MNGEITRVAMTTGLRTGHVTPGTSRTTETQMTPITDRGEVGFNVTSFLCNQ